MKKPKYTVHRKITNVPESPVNGLPKVVKITVTDPCATDSSSDEETEESIFPEPRIKRYVEEIRFSDAKPVKKPVVTEKVDGGTVKYRGVRQRPWGKFAAEIRDSSTRTRIWLGTFATAYEAAIGYDKAAIRLKGHNALTNFLTPPPPPPATNSSPISPPVIDIETASGCDSARESQSSLCSPTSVLRFYRNDGTEFIPEHGTEYGTGFGTEQNKVSSGESKVVNEETPADLSTDSFFLPDLFQSGDIFWDSHIASSDPLFLDEMESFSVKDSDLFEGFPLSTIGDFNSGSWDVDEFFRE